MYSFSFVHCWGNNSVGQLGQPYSVQTSPSPLRIAGLNVPSRLTCGHQHACIMDGHSPKCWGLNSTGQLGNGSTVNSHVALPVNTPYEYKQIAAGYDHTCGLVAQPSSSNNLLQCWGGNASGQLGTGDGSSIKMTPATLARKGWIWVAAGVSMTCAIDSDIYCWGANDQGQLGTGDQNQYSLPTMSVETTGFTQVSAWGKTTCGIDDKGQMWCWGDGSAGQMGNNTYTADNLTPVLVQPYKPWNPDPTTFISISSGGNHVCATDVTWQMFCWGDNTYGQCGVNSATPTQPRLWQPLSWDLGIASARNNVTLYRIVTCMPDDQPTVAQAPQPHGRKLLN
ncbi:hypothetical protein H632_c3792p0 [Helicosporidium sp. ATCC 50920]|nr:hypothetical protein H632_c3792p0 [Helicosporidium sp. ATCC 50920]|eukprot:KDD72144.1 hypothetical protein H632_c3792p0 [Helicosporidium sp. ATCC 50920]